MSFKEIIEKEITDLANEINNMGKLERKLSPEQLAKDHYLIKSNYILARTNLILALSNIAGDTI
ncbi:hypothetical protein [Paenibacillus alkalitolerans]|uniref:hypothetical protein n=1 Tax=Paenibacillus alkalitolerans TaxID=2799335 RepID=UPI0018F6CF13|nr:hypothetical protein [Paenibacillus alkalitolerans]